MAGTLPGAAGTFLYEQVEHQVREMIESGVLKPGDRAPSLRQLARQSRVSIATASQAYVSLERKGYVEAREKSGFYVRRRPMADDAVPRPLTQRNAARRVQVRDVVQSILSAAHEANVDGVPDADLIRHALSVAAELWAGIEGVEDREESERIARPARQLVHVADILAVTTPA